MDFFGEKGTLVVATKHEKETIVGPLFQKAFPWFLLPCGPLDTDAFGTFSGEKERIGTPLEVLKQKCQAASQLVQADFYFATEASFGPHPECPFLPFYEEWVMLYAPSLALEWIEVKRSTQTNFRTMEITTWPGLVKFAWEIGFPEHALILQQDHFLEKGIRDWDMLRYFFRQRALDKPFIVETDMRAMCNPTRQSAIADLTLQLIQRLKQPCPSCKKPGFGLQKPWRGLRCEACHLPTHLAKGTIVSCPFCGCQVEEMFPHLSGADPAYCSFCNP